MESLRVTRKSSTYIKSVRTPTLIQHGETDARVPTPNAYELHRGLRDIEVDTDLIIFKGMAYSSEQPGMTVAIMKQNLMWFSHYLPGESMDGQLRMEQPVPQPNNLPIK